MNRVLSLLLAAVASGLSACSTLVPAPQVDLAGKDPDAAWERHLAAHVSADGSIDFEGMRAAPEDLETYVAWVAERRSAELSRPGPAELAYLVNAYNALAMYNVLHAGVPPSSKLRVFYLRELEENGRRISLYDFENDVIRERGDPRIHFALNCMVRSCPRLPREPFRPEALEAQLDAAAREFLGDARHVELDPEGRTVRFSSILDWYSEDFLAVAPSLIAYANRYRDDEIPEDWDVEFLDYDWTLNQAR